MSPLLIDAFLELEAIEAEILKLETALKRVDDLVMEIDGWLVFQGIASVVEKVYTGLEKVMMRIVATVDGNPVAQTEDRHIALLRCLAHEYEGTRPRLLQTDTFNALNALRAFRHRERNTYGSDLRIDAVLDNARAVQGAVRLFRRDLVALDQILS